MGLVIERSTYSYFEDWEILKISFLSMQFSQLEYSKKFIRVHFSQWHNIFSKCIYLKPLQEIVFSIKNSKFSLHVSNIKIN